MTSSNISRISTFLKDGLVELIAPHAQLDVIISTYNPIMNLATGFLPNMPTGLRVLMHFGSHANGPAGEALRETETSFIQRATQSQTPKLAFVYYGLGAGTAPIESGCVLHRELGAKVVLVACDCDAHEKRKAVFPHMASGEIHNLIIGPACGGEHDLTQILHALVDLWSRRTHEQSQRVH
jgi:hypothetical protein